MTSLKHIEQDPDDHDKDLPDHIKRVFPKLALFNHFLTNLAEDSKHGTDVGGLVLFAARPMDYAARERSRMRSFAEHLSAVDKDMHHAGGVLVRVLKGGVIPDFIRIKDGQVCVVSFLKRPPAMNLKVGGRQGC